MRIFSASYGVRVTAHNKRHVLDRDFVETYGTTDHATEKQLRDRLAVLIPMRTEELTRTPGRIVVEELRLVRIAANAILANLDKGGSLDAPRQLLFEDDDDYGTVTARLWINITHHANRPYKISKEAPACMSS